MKIIEWNIYSYFTYYLCRFFQILLCHSKFMRVNFFCQFWHHLYMWFINSLFHIIRFSYLSFWGWFNFLITSIPGDSKATKFFYQQSTSILYDKKIMTVRICKFEDNKKKHTNLRKINDESFRTKWKVKTKIQKPLI